MEILKEKSVLAIDSVCVPVQPPLPTLQFCSLVPGEPSSVLLSNLNILLKVNWGTLRIMSLFWTKIYPNLAAGNRKWLGARHQQEPRERLL